MSFVFTSEVVKRINAAHKLLYKIRQMQQVCSNLFFIFPSLHKAQLLSYPLPSCVTIRESFSRYFIYSAYLLCTSLPLSPQASVTFLTVPTPFSHAPSSQPLLPCECYTNPCVCDWFSFSTFLSCIQDSA